MTKENNKELEELQNYEKEALFNQLKVTWTYTSNAIEGNTLSLGDTAFIIENGLTVSGKSISEHNEVIGHIRAIDIIYSLLDRDSIIQDNLFDLHKAIQTNLLIDYERPNGAYKVVPNGRWLNIDDKSQYFYYPLPDEVSHLMELWFDEYGYIKQDIFSKEDAIRVYTNMHISFAGIHPFWDGNGRLARLISNIPLLKNGYLPIIIDNKNRREYIELLSKYNINSKPLETNSQYQDLLNFFEGEYENSYELLRSLRDKRY